MSKLVLNLFTMTLPHLNDYDSGLQVTDFTPSKKKTFQTFSLEIFHDLNNKNYVQIFKNLMMY